MKMKMLPLHVAIAGAMGVAIAAHADSQESHDNGNDSATIEKNISLDQDVEHKGYIQTLGLVLVDSTATSISDVEQFSVENNVNNGVNTENNARATGDALNGASGNIGLNIAAGDNNVQQNSTAISSIQSPDGSPISVETGYSETVHEAGETNVSFDAAHQQSSSAAAARSGAVSYAASESLTVDATGSYDHSQDEHSTSETEIDAGVNGTMTYVYGAGSVSEKEMALPTEMDEGSVEMGELEHEQTAGWVTGKVANLNVEEGSDFEETDTTETNSATTIGADFTISASASEDKSFSAEWSESQEQAESGSVAVHKDAHDEYSYDYNEYATVDAELVFGAALDAETFSRQGAFGNETLNYGTNNATLNGNVGSGAAGNIGINITAGNSNAQANQLAIAAGNNAVMATATAASSQKTAGNYTDNGSEMVLLGYSQSNIALEQTGEATGSYIGLSDQANNVYPDVWPGEDGQPHDPHPTSDSFWGHVDIDSDNQGAEHAPVDHAAHDPDGSLLFKEAGELTLSGITMGGTAENFVYGYVAHTNNATISGSALSGATGNIGVNVSAGTNNLQGNALAISSVNTAGGDVGAGGGEL